MSSEEYFTVDLSDYQGKRLELSKVFESKDYNMKLVLYPNGVEAYVDKSLSVFIVFICGPKDDTLNWPFRGTIQVTIKKPNDSGKTYKKAISFYLLEDSDEAGQKPHDDSRAKGNGLQDFISLNNLEDFKNDNKIEIKASVQN